MDDLYKWIEEKCGEKGIKISKLRTQTDTMTASMTVGMRAMTAILLNESPSRARARKRYI